MRTVGRAPRCLRRSNSSWLAWSHPTEVAGRSVRAWRSNCRRKAGEAISCALAFAAAAHIRASVLLPDALRPYISVSFRTRTSSRREAWLSHRPNRPNRSTCPIRTSMVRDYCAGLRSRERPRTRSTSCWDGGVVSTRRSTAVRRSSRRPHASSRPPRPDSNRRPSSWERNLAPRNDCGFLVCRALNQHVASGGATHRQSETVDRTVDRKSRR
jgi:hypothetical protein